MTKIILFTKIFKGKKFNPRDIEPIKTKPRRPFSVKSFKSFFLNNKYLSKKPLIERNKQAIEICIKIYMCDVSNCIIKKLFIFVNNIY